MSRHLLSRRDLLRHAAAVGLTVPFLPRSRACPPSETLRHASFGAAGMAGADIQSLTASPHLQLVAVAEVDLKRADEIKSRFPHVRVYQDWRRLLDEEKDLDSVNVSTPDHMHAPITMRALRQGLHVYTQKPLTQTIHEARQLARVAREKGLVTQMGIQIHSHPVHKSVVATIQAGAIGKVKEVHSWSGKEWGSSTPRPSRVDEIPSGFDWDLWIGVATPRPFIAGYYHPGEWRRRLEFGTGTFGDMGCHILDPVFSSLALTAPIHVHSEGGHPNGDSWGLHSRVRYLFPGTPHTTETVSLTWYDGNQRPSTEVTAALGDRPLSDQGSLYIGTEGVLYSPYIDNPILLPAEKFAGYERPEPPGDDHYLQFVEACRGNGSTSTPFSYSGPMTEAVLLGCLATRFPNLTLEWDPQSLRITNNPEASALVRRSYRQGWEVDDL